MPVLNTDALIQNRVEAIRQYHKEVGLEKAELDLSGGVDSAVMLGLLVRALGANNVIAVFSDLNSSPNAKARALECALAFDVRLCFIQLTDIYDDLVYRIAKSAEDAGYPFSFDGKATALQFGAFRSTLRAPIGRAFNRFLGGGIRHGTGNEDEDRFLRFYQKGGDGEVDTNPIAMLSKGEVFQLARALGVPCSILTARPSPDLWGVGEAHNDEDEIRGYLFGDAEVPEGTTFYSYIDVDTGEYTHVGLIERIARCEDWIFWESPEWSEGSTLSQALTSRLDVHSERHQASLFEKSSLTPIAEIPDAVVEIRNRFFPEYTYAFVRDLLLAARRVEAMTAHKANPNIPTLGDRMGLEDAGILTSVLPFRKQAA